MSSKNEQKNLQENNKAMKKPAGLFDNNVEIVEHNGKAYALYNGNKIPVTELPSNIYDAFFNQMLADEEAMNVLQKTEMSLSDRFNQFLICRYGAIDHNPDYDTSKENFTPEFYDCGLREDCKLFKYKLCQMVKINDALVTKREIEVIKLIASGKTDDQVADKLGIARDTLLTHKKNIYSKLKVQSQSQLTLLAVQNNLIQ